MATSILCRLKEKEEQAKSANIFGLLKTLEFIALEVDVARFKAFKPNLEEVLMMCCQNIRDIIEYCEEINEILNIHYFNPIAAEVDLVKRFKYELAKRFEFWSCLKDKIRLKDKYLDKIPWKEVFKSFSNNVRNKINEMLLRYQKYFPLNNVGYCKELNLMIEKLKDLGEKIKNYDFDTTSIISLEELEKPWF